MLPGMSEEYYKNLPRKRMAVGVVLHDADTNILIVKPSYKDGWLLPGGIVEANEPLHAACRREVHEEIGLDVSKFRLLCVDHMSDEQGYGDSLQILFYGGTVNPQDVRPDGKEIVEARFMPVDEALKLLSVNTQRRLPHALTALTEGAVYLENGGHPVHV